MSIQFNAVAPKPLQNHHKLNAQPKLNVSHFNHVDQFEKTSSTPNFERAPGNMSTTGD